MEGSQLATSTSPSTTTLDLVRATGRVILGLAKVSMDASNMADENSRHGAHRSS